MVKELLAKFGFSEKETAVYLALFGLGASVVSDIARKAHINRSTAYVVLDALTKRGVVNITERRGVKMYHPVSPDNLVKHFEQMAQQYSELAIQAKKILPKLKAETEPSAQLGPRIRLFEGAEGMRTVYQDAVASLEMIRSHGKKGSHVGSHNINIYENKIVLTAPGEKFALVIESAELAESLKKALS